MPTEKQIEAAAKAICKARYGHLRRYIVRVQFYEEEPRAALEAAEKVNAMNSYSKTDPALLEALEEVKRHVLTPEEYFAQRRSFVRGMCPSNRDYAEWCEQVDKVLGGSEQQKGET